MSAGAQILNKNLLIIAIVNPYISNGEYLKCLKCNSWMFRFGIRRWWWWRGGGCNRRRGCRCFWAVVRERRWIWEMSHLSRTFSRSRYWNSRELWPHILFRVYWGVVKGTLETLLHSCCLENKLKIVSVLPFVYDYLYHKYTFSSLSLWSLPIYMLLLNIPDSTSLYLPSLIYLTQLASTCLPMAIMSKPQTW